MKRVLWYILAIVFAVASCTGGKVSPRLVAIDSLITTDPDSA